jgi:hypothetical protein
MSAGAAPLTASLLARKGNAVPVVFAPRFFDAPAVMQLPFGHDGGQMIEAVARDRRTSVRLDPPRQRRLRLLAGRLGVSKQALLVRAFDEIVAREAPDLAAAEDMVTEISGDDGAALGLGDGHERDPRDAG